MPPIAKNTDLIDVKDFGADPSAADNTTAVQNAIDAAFSRKATVVFTDMFPCADHLYIYGDVSFIGAQESDGISLTASPTNGFYWLIAGTSGFGATSANGRIQTWTGSMRDMTISSTLLANANVEQTHIRSVNLASFEDVTFENVRFEFDSVESAMGGIGRYNNANFANGQISSEGVTVNNCKFRIRPRSITSEAFGFGDCQRITITNNHIYGVGDDAVGLHNVKNIVVAGNQISTVDGRILLESCQNGIVCGNRLERIPAFDGSVVSGGALIYLSVLPSDTSSQVTTDITISDNEVIHAEGITSATYGIRLIGTRSCAVDNNRILNCANVGYGVTWEGQMLSPTWTDPDTIDNTNVVLTRDLKVTGNYAYNAAIQGGLGPNNIGPVLTLGNIPTPTNIGTNQEFLEINGHEFSIDSSGRLLIDGSAVGSQ